MTNVRQNRRQLLKRAGVLGALAALFSPSAALAQTNPTTNTPDIGGSWRVTFTPQGSGTPPPFQALHSFTGDGAITTAEQRDQVPPVMASPGHGSWTRLPSNDGPEDFVYSYQKLLVDTQGNLIGTQTFNIKVELIEGGKAFKGSGTSVFQASTGNTATGNAATPNFPIMFPIMLHGTRI